MAESALRDDPDEVRWCLDILGECALVLEGASVYESRNVVSDLGTGDVLSNLHNISREVDAKDRSGLPVVVNI